MISEEEKLASEVVLDEGMHCILERDSYLFTHNGAVV